MKQRDYPGERTPAGNDMSESMAETMVVGGGEVASPDSTEPGGVRTGKKEQTVLMGSMEQTATAREPEKRTAPGRNRATRQNKNRNGRHWAERLDGSPPGENSFSPGDIFQGKYEIVRLLGAGGMGQVYEARHNELEATVALKIMARHLTHQPQAVERFKREARAMARVQHPHAVRVLDAGAEENCLYLIMEFLDGQNLREWHAGFRQQNQSPPMPDIWQYTREVLSVLEFMHRQQITHRDLKPDNIFLARDAEGKTSVKVLDFGIAKVQSADMVKMTGEGLMMGTPGYMSPEQCLGTRVDGRSDIYSMGVVLYELLTGTLPFPGTDPIGIAMKHVHETPPPLQKVNPAIPPSIAGVIHRALEKSPEKRFQTALEFWQAIETATGLNHPGGQKHPDGGRDSVRMPDPSWSDASPQQFPSEAAITDKMERAAATGLPAGRTRIGEVRLPWAQPEKREPSVAIPQTIANPAQEIKTTPRMPGVRWGRLVLLLAGLAMTAMLMARVMPFQSPHIPEVMKEGAETPPAGLEGFVPITGGEFVMGRAPGRETVEGLRSDAGRIPEDETPAHPVQVRDFYLARHETTNAEYRAFVLATGAPPPAGWKGNEYPPGQEAFPVTGVSWNEARDYCAWLTRTRGGAVLFRLPTEAEWEYAARGRDGRIFPWGSFWREGMANTGQAFGKQQTLLLPVGVEPNNTRDRSATGILGMGGNVCEWTASEFGVYPGSSYRPTGRDRECRVYRGGHFASPVAEATCTSRKWTLPDRRSEFVGFRVAADWTPKNRTHGQE